MGSTIAKQEVKQGTYSFPSLLYIVFKNTSSRLGSSISRLIMVIPFLANSSLMLSLISDFAKIIALFSVVFSILIISGISSSGNGCLVSIFISYPSNSMYCFFISSSVPTVLSFPLTIIPTLSASSSTSLSMWDEKKTVFPCFLCSLIISFTSLAPSGSRPLVGSSRIKSSGSFMRA
ncbi:176aa long hypothetical protein [Pyrococcus horikoshii OT3]|uniref:Uncharacterized protein n=1 Tax=Pyrococcus horikoshii (strain ATCC 700860 / DSM 12428 / JCM 9974 / NBRC 100139 / OT-3) TaxID=70601 RepID=O59092_PYRHO|nr:176aa long hypothetical protein [Pyrococcus horikoshii OT3]